MALYLPDDEPVVMTWTDPSTGFRYQARVAIQRRGPHRGKISIVAPNCVHIESKSLAKKRERGLKSQRHNSPPPG